MRIIISPAKKMVVNTDGISYVDKPQFLAQTKKLMKHIKSLSYSKCKDIWRCNDKIAKENYQRFSDMDLEQALTPAIMSYQGIQYQYMAPSVAEQSVLDYLQTHLRILSGFYGMLKPYDGIVPYRLEMQSRIGDKNLDSLYNYWGNTLAKKLFSEDTCILNLASKEYSRCIKDYVGLNITFISCKFVEQIDGKLVEKATFAKMARGEMVRFLAENQVEDIIEIRKFGCLGYCYSEEYSDKDTLVFIKTIAK